MALRKRGGIWYFRKMINGRLFRESTGFADRKAAERRANEIELDIRAGVHGWKSTIPSFAEWWDVYRKTYTPLKSAGNRDAQIVVVLLLRVDGGIELALDRRGDRPAEPQRPARLASGFRLLPENSRPPALRRRLQGVPHFAPGAGKIDHQTQ